MHPSQRVPAKHCPRMQMARLDSPSHGLVEYIEGTMEDVLRIRLNVYQKISLEDQVLTRNRKGLMLLSKSVGHKSTMLPLFFPEKSSSLWVIS